MQKSSATSKRVLRGRKKINESSIEIGARLWYSISCTNWNLRRILTGIWKKDNWRRLPIPCTIRLCGHCLADRGRFSDWFGKKEIWFQCMGTSE